MNNIGNNEDVSKYFVNYINNNSKPQLEQYGIDFNDIPEFKQSQLIGINSPIINTKKLNIKPPTQEEPTIQPQSYTKVGKDKNSIGKYIVNYFQNKGLTKEQASGIAGNLFKESSFKTNAIGDTHLPTSSEGIAQWREGRLNNLKNFAKNKNVDYKDLNTQLDYLWDELNSSEKTALTSLKQSNTVEESARNFANKFERMKTYSKDRENYAKYFYNI